MTIRAVAYYRKSNADDGGSIDRQREQARAACERARVELAAELFDHAGYRAGYDLAPRDWRMPDEWHRGYLRGRLAGLRDRSPKPKGGR
jgi:hypothetical protein